MHLLTEKFTPICCDFLLLSLFLQNPVQESVDVVLDCLHGCCNGPNRVMQDLLREQDTYGRSTVSIEVILFGIRTTAP